MAIGKVNIGSGGKGEVLIEFNNYVSDNLVNNKIVLEIPIGSKYKFTEHEKEQISEYPSILVNSPATGYIKPINGVIVTPPSIPASILFGATEGENQLQLRGTSVADSINDGFLDQNPDFDCTIDWGDGSTTVVPPNGGNVDHSYATAGDYNIQISGKSFAGFQVQYNGDQYKELYSMGKWEVDTMIDLSSAFNNCTGLTIISPDAFKYNTKLTNIYKIFNLCSNLTTIPADLFKYNTAITNAENAFYNCNKLTLRDDIFGLDYSTRFNGKDVNFWACFNRYSFDGTQGKAPELWNFTGLTGGRTECFYGNGNSTTSLSNYDDIPAEWK